MNNTNIKTLILQYKNNRNKNLVLQNILKKKINKKKKKNKNLIIQNI